MMKLTSNPQVFVKRINYVNTNEILHICMPARFLRISNDVI